jgi:hypothetical protein
MKDTKTSVPVTRKSGKEWKVVEKENLIDAFLKLYKSLGFSSDKLPARIIPSSYQENCLEFQLASSFMGREEFYTQFWIAEHEVEDKECANILGCSVKRTLHNLTTGYQTNGTRDEPPGFVEVELGDFSTLAQALEECLKIELHSRWEEMCESVMWETAYEQEKEDELI